MQTGSLPSDHFEQAARCFAAWWAACRSDQPPWRWVAHEQPVTGQVTGYLEGGFIASPPPPPHAPLRPAGALAQPADAGGGGNDGAGDGGCGAQATEGPWLVDDGGADDATLHPPAARHTGPQQLLLRLHIAHHPSYQVPVLCVRAARPDGAVLGLGGMLAALPSLARHRGPDTPDWAFLAQMEHPALQQPWHMLHPCQTADLMALLLQPSSGSHSSPPNAASPAAGPAAATPAGTGAGAGMPAGTGAGAGGADSPLLRYMLAWWSLVGPALGLPTPVAAGAAASRVQ